MPHAYEVSGDPIDAVEKLLRNSSRLGVSLTTLVIDQKLSNPWHVEMTIRKPGNEKY